MSSEEIRRPVELTETEAAMIHTALTQYARRCEQNAINAMSGYGTVESLLKRDEWDAKGEEAQKLASYVIYQQAGI